MQTQPSLDEAADRLAHNATFVGVLPAVLIGVVRCVKAAWSCRSPMRTALVISNREPAIGDHLIGALELAESESEQARSGSLCAAALQQVADEAVQHDFHDALPPSRRKAYVAASIVMMWTRADRRTLADLAAGTIVVRDQK